MNITDEKWLEMADRFVLGPYGPSGIGLNYAIESRMQIDGTQKWAITVGDRQCVNKDLELVNEPMPSSRDEDYFASHRYASKDEAYETWLKYKEESQHYKMMQEMYKRK